jgi:hypothetical protein
MLLFMLLTAPAWLGCSGSTTVKPADAEKVPADAPVGEEKPSTDEQ